MSCHPSRSRIAPVAWLHAVPSVRGTSAVAAAARAAAWVVWGVGTPLLAALPALHAQAAPSEMMTAAVPRSARVFRLSPAATATDTVPDPLRRPVTLRLTGVTVERALQHVAARAGVTFSYSRAVVPLERLVSVDVADAPVLDALGQILAGADVELWVSAEGRMALVPAGRVAEPMPAPGLAALPSAVSAGEVARTGTSTDEALVGVVSGRVATADGTPLSDVTLRVAGTQLGARTGADGRYTVTGVPDGQRTIVAQRVGFAPDSVRVTVAAGQPAQANFTLRQVATQLQEVVTIGYGTTTRRDLTGSVAVVTGDDLKTQAAPTVTLSNALQGRAAGVQVVTNSGLPGAGARVRIRGTGSITANAEPLYVIDGLPAVQGTNSGNPQDNPLLSVDPSEIESIQVLKDASATAIYGARGANGVVLIQTRRGQRGETRVALESSAGTQRIANDIDVLNAPDFMRLVNEARVNAGLATIYTDAQIGSAQTFNYPGMMLRTASQMNHALSLSGGEQRLRYLLGGNYTNQRGIAIGSDFERFGGRFNLDSDVSARFRVGTNVSLTRFARNASAVENGSLGNSANGLQAALQFDPSQAPRDSTGAWVKTARTTEPVPNPVANASELTDLNTTARLLGNAYAEYDLTRQLQLRSTFGGNYQNDRINFFAPRTILAGGVGGSGFLFSNEIRDLTNENTLTFRGDVGPGDLTAVGGFSVQTFNNQFVQGNGSNFPTDETSAFALGTGAQLMAAGSGFGESAILSYLGRVNYNLADRYLITLTARRDGSSRFGANNKWSTFPSAALAWRVSQEPFLRGIKQLSDLKVRLSYGQVGNQAVNSYQSLSALGTTFASFGGTEVPALAPTGTMPNPNLRWEQKTSFNAGVDASLFSDRVTLSVDAYRDVTSDLLLSVALPSTTGFGSQLQNIGSVRNRGLELSLSTVNVSRGRFSWRSTLNVAGNRNRVVDLGAQDSLFVAARGGGFFNPGQTHIVKEGVQLGAIYGFVVDGLWQQGETCTLNVARDCTPGEFKLRDLNGDRAITTADRQILGYGDPKYYGGLANDFTLGPLTLNAFVNFVQGNKIINAGSAFGTLAIGQANERTAVLNRWTPTNTNTMVPRANNTRQRRLYSTLVEDGSYVRLQTLTLGYRVPARLLPRAESARLFVTGQNLWVSTDYTGFDPDVNSSGGDARVGGVDVGAYPRQRSWNVGLNLTF